MPRATIVLPDEYSYQTAIRLRITDMNYGGHLGNDIMLSLLQEARIRFLNQFGYSETDVEGCGIIMADAVVIYKNQAFYPDTLIFELAVSDFSRRACDFIYKISRQSDGKEIARAKTRIAFFDYKKNTTVNIPAKFREIFL